MTKINNDMIIPYNGNTFVINYVNVEQKFLFLTTQVYTPINTFLSCEFIHCVGSFTDRIE